MKIGRRVMEALQELNDMSNVQDERRLALKQKRKNRLSKKSKYAITRKGKGAIQLNSKADNNSEAGATDNEYMSDYSSSN